MEVIEARICYFDENMKLICHAQRKNSHSMSRIGNLMRQLKKSAFQFLTIPKVPPTVRYRGTFFLPAWLWALSTRREGLYRGSPGIVILWNVPLTPLVDMLQPDNLFAYQCRPPPTQHQTPTIKILFSAAFYAAPEKHYFIPKIFVEFIKMIKRASVSYLHFQFSISPACWVQSAQCGCCPQLRARVTQFLFPLQSTSNTTSVR